MPFAPNIAVCSSEDCKFLGFTDESGLFNVSTNTTGYRTDNLAEITRIQTVAQGGGAGQVTGADYFTLNSPQTLYHVWFDLDNGSVDPAPANSTGIEVNIATGATAATVATNLAAAINAFVYATPGFTATVNSDLVTITNVQTGNTANAANGPGANSPNFTITVLQQGVWNDVAPGDVTAAFIQFEVAGVTYVYPTFQGVATVVNITTDAITITAHGLLTRDPVILTSSNTPATLPGGLAINTVYYVIRIDANTIALATSLLNATAGTRINLTTVGTDTITVRTNVLPVFPTLPNTAGTQMLANTADLNYATSTKFPDGMYVIRYVLTGNGGGTAFTQEVTRDFLVYCLNKCCVYDMIAKVPEANCSCDSDVVERALFAFTMLQALKYSAQSGQDTRAANINSSLTALCAQNDCTSCK